MKDTVAYDVVPTTVAEAVAARAAAVVRRHALDADDRRELLGALGLPDEADADGGQGDADRAELGRPVDNEDQGDDAEQDPRAVGYRALAGAILAGDEMED